MSYVNGQPLRVDPTQLTLPVVMVSAGNPTAVPNMAIAQPLLPYARYIVSLVQIEIESKAAQSPVRIHAHNLLAQNNFQNADFVELLDIVFGYINSLMSFNPQFSDIQSCINAVVPHVVGAWSAAQVRLYPDLMRYLNPQQQQVAQNAVANIQQIVSDINRSKQVPFQGAPVGQGSWNGAPQPQLQSGWMQGAQPSYPAPVIGQQVGFSVPIQGTPATAGLFVNRQRSLNSAPEPVAVLSSDQANKSAERMRRQLMAQHGVVEEQEHSPAPPPPPTPPPPPPPPPVNINPFNNPQARAIKEKFSNQLHSQLEEMQSTPAPETKIEKPVFQSSIETFVMELTEPTTAVAPSPSAETLTSADWQRSVHQDYHPAWSTSLHKPVYSRMPDGSVVCAIVKREEGDNNMDYEAHAIGVQPTQKATFDRDATGEVIKNKTEEIEKIEYPQTVIEFIDNDDITVEISDRVPAVSAGMLGEMAGFITNKDQAYHTTTCIAEPVLTENAETMEYSNSVIKKASACDTFEKLWDLMQAMTSENELNLRARMNQVLTRAINDVLVANVSPGTYIDDFETDGRTLIKEIRNKYKDRVALAIAGDQERVIKTTLGIIDSAAANSMNENIKSGLRDSAQWKGYLSFITCRVTHTHLQYSAAELNLAFPRRQMGLLSEEYTPVLFYVAQEILNSALKEKVPPARHYIVTKDGLVMMVQRGLLNPQAYLVRVVD